MSTWIPIAALTVATCGFTVAFLVGLRSRNLFSPRLSFRYRAPLTFRAKRRGYMLRDPQALFFVAKRHAEGRVHLPIHLKNNSRRKITDVTIELQYPRAFFVSNRELARELDEAMEYFPEREGEIETIREWSAERRVTPYQDIVTVTHKLGTILPGRDRLFYEPLDMPTRDAAFSDMRFDDTMFGEILHRLKMLHFIRGVCHVRGTIYSDLLRPSRTWVNVLSMKGDLAHASMQELILPYVLAHWADRFPTGFHFRPALPFLRAYRQPIVRQCTIDLINPKVVAETTMTDADHIGARWLDAQGSSYAVGFAGLPGYDYFRLPAGLSVEDALHLIGFAKPSLLFRKSRPEPTA
jgi:hypothetical protein